MHYCSKSFGTQKLFCGGDGELGPCPIWHHSQYIPHQGRFFHRHTGNAWPVSVRNSTYFCLLYFLCFCLLAPWDDNERSLSSAYSPIPRATGMYSLRIRSANNSLCCLSTRINKPNAISFTWNNSGASIPNHYNPLGEWPLEVSIFKI